MAITPMEPTPPVRLTSQARGRAANRIGCRECGIGDAAQMGFTGISGTDPLAEFEHAPCFTTGGIDVEHDAFDRGIC
jgi:hypothetical protein